MGKQTRGKRITPAQKNAMMDFLESKPELASGKFDSTFTYQIANNLWVDLSIILNAIPPGSQKDGKSWRKTWQDIKSDVRKKAYDIKKYASGNESEPSNYILSEFEERVVELIEETSGIGKRDVSDVRVIFAEPIDVPEIDLNIVKTENNIELYMNNNEDNDTNENIKPLPSETVPHVPHIEADTVTPTRKRKGTGSEKLEETTITYDLSASIEKKIAINEAYYKKKLKIMERIANAKERSAIAKEKTAEALAEIARSLKSSV